MAAARQNFDSDSSDINSFTGGSGSKLKGHPVQVVVATDEHNFELDENALEEVLLNPKIKDKHVVVVSVAGAFRKGKSFLLDFFLRYMHAQGSEDWLGNDCTPLQGFPWRGGADRDTTGILMWSEPFEVTLPSGDEVVVLLMDTQGAFDDQSTVKDCATVFALSTMISSVQVFNISSNIQEDDLQHLQLFTEYGRLALEDNGSKPFQALWFLVRDWSYPYQFDYGETGGIKLLEKRLQVGNRQHPELQQLRRHIHACFSQIDCFLMPHPGLKVATSPRFDGKLSDIEVDFKEMLHSLVPLLLRNDKLVLKEIHGSKITAKDLVEYFKAYINVFKGDELPEPKSMLQATAEANNLSAVANAKEAYTREMEMVCGGDQPYLHPDQLAREHVRIRDYAIRQFAATKKMGGINFSEAYKEKLASEVEEQYENYAKHNASKNIFAAARTPAVLFAIMAICYLSSGVLGIVGLENLANLLNFLVGLAVVLLSVWAYIRYSGDHREIGGYIDTFAELIWENAMGPVLKKIAKGHSVPVAAAVNRLDKKDD